MRASFTASSGRVSGADPRSGNACTFVHCQAWQKGQDILCCLEGSDIGEEGGEGMGNEDAAAAMKTSGSGGGIEHTGDVQIYYGKKGIFFREC